MTTDVASFADEPVTLEEVKRHLNLLFDTEGSAEFDDDDTYLFDLVRQCRESVEQTIGVSMAVKTYKAILRNECGGIEIPFGPIAEIISVVDKEGNVLASGTDYSVRGSGFKWIEQPCVDYLEVYYTSGYTQATIPSGLKRALLEEIAFRYNHRGDAMNVTANIYFGICQGAREKAAPYTRKSFIG